MPSFDIVSKVDPQTLDNALNTVNREIQNRYDFRDSKGSIDFDKKTNIILVTTENTMRLGQIDLWQPRADPAGTIVTGWRPIPWFRSFWEQTGTDVAALVVAAIVGGPPAAAPSFLAADLGCMFGGTISITLQKYAGIGLINARRSAFTVGAVMMLGVAFVGLVDNPYVAVALLSLAGFAHQTLSVTVITMASDLFKRNEVATVAGMAGTCGNAGVLIFSLVMGALVDVSGYPAAIAVLLLAAAVQALAIWRIGDEAG